MALKDYLGYSRLMSSKWITQADSLENEKKTLTLLFMCCVSEIGNKWKFTNTEHLSHMEPSLKLCVRVTSRIWYERNPVERVGGPQFLGWVSSIFICLFIHDIKSIFYRFYTAHLMDKHIILILWWFWCNKQVA